HALTRSALDGEDAPGHGRQASAAELLARRRREARDLAQLRAPERAVRPVDVVARDDAAGAAHAVEEERDLAGVRGEDGRLVRRAVHHDVDPLARAHAVLAGDRHLTRREADLLRLARVVPPP